MLIITEKYGQLCNRLFLFAHVIAFAIENKLKVFNPAFDEYCQFFKTTNKDLFCRYPHKRSLIKGNRWLRYIYYRLVHLIFRINNILNIAPKIRLHFEKERFDFSDYKALNQVRQIKNTPITFLSGFYFRDPPNFERYANEIRKYFQPLDKYQLNISHLIKKARKKCDILMGVHIRRGDYRMLKKLYFYTDKEYIAIMKSIKKLFPDKKVSFFIVSNAKLDKALFENLTCCFGSNDMIEDLYSLAQCNYIIGPPSTYTRWASFYGQVPLHVINYKEAEIHGEYDPNRRLQIEDFVIYRGKNL